MSGKKKKNTSAVNNAEKNNDALKVNLHKIFVGNLNVVTTDKSLKDFFKKVGSVLDAFIIKQDDKSKGFGFVAYGTLTEAEKAIKELNKKKLDGRKINVELAKPREVKPKKENRNKNKKSRENKQEKIEGEIETINPVSSVENAEQVTEEPKSIPTIFVKLSFFVGE